MSTIAIIPARSGSKGLKGKNVFPVFGKPLMGYSIEAALDSGCFDEVFVSTDSECYAEIGRKLGAKVPFLRSEALASDTAGSWELVEEALTRYAALEKRFDRVMLLQPTSPLRNVEDIRAAFAVMEKKCAHAVVSVCEADHSPQFMKPLPANGCLDGFVPHANNVRRQAQETYYRINGAIYLLDTNWFLHGGMRYDESVFAYVMPQKRSLDIDTWVDIAIMEGIMNYENRDLGK